MSEPIELPRTIRISGARDTPADTSAYSIEVPLVDAIAAVQNAGYLVYEIGELPKVTQDGNGKPKLPPMSGTPFGDDRVRRHYEEGFRSIALARWWEKEEVRREKRIEAMRGDIQDVPSRTSYETDVALAEYLVGLGWRRG